jgi:hypothetical protein
MKKDKPIQYEIYRKGDHLLSYLFLNRLISKIREPYVNRLGIAVFIYKIRAEQKTRLSPTDSPMISLFIQLLSNQYYCCANSSTNSENRFNAFSIGAGVDKSTPVFFNNSSG